MESWFNTIPKKRNIVIKYNFVINERITLENSDWTYYDIGTLFFLLFFFHRVHFMLRTRALKYTLEVCDINNSCFGKDAWLFKSVKLQTWPKASANDIPKMSIFHLFMVWKYFIGLWLMVLTLSILLTSNNTLTHKM